MGRRFRLPMAGLAVALVMAWMPFPSRAATCDATGVSNGHTLCIILPAGPTLIGPSSILVTNQPNTGTVIYTWIPGGGPSIRLMTDFAPSPETGDYSFTWPTQKYLDASGTLRAQVGGTGATPVDVAVTLSNGNLSDIQHTPNDWSLPSQWTGSDDPVLAAVGDSPSDEPDSNAVSDALVTANPALVLFLGDIYEDGTYVENLNHYGVSALDNPAGATLWGRLAAITQPTVGNHEYPNLSAWTDYWHQRPDVTSFTFGGVLFLDLDSSKSVKVRSPQYTFVQNQLAGAPSCVVAFFHIPVLNGSSTTTKLLPMWKLLADNGADLAVNGHKHAMLQYVPLDDTLTAGTMGAHLVELISGAGGHKTGGAATDPRIAWSKGKIPGVLLLTLEGAGGGGVPTSISWQYVKVDLVSHNLGAVLYSGSVDCTA